MSLPPSICFRTGLSVGFSEASEILEELRPAYARNEIILVEKLISFYPATELSPVEARCLCFFGDTRMLLSLLLLTRLRWVLFFLVSGPNLLLRFLPDTLWSGIFWGSRLRRISWAFGMRSGCTCLSTYVKVLKPSFLTFSANMLLELKPVHSQTSYFPTSTLTSIGRFNCAHLSNLDVQGGRFSIDYRTSKFGRPKMDVIWTFQF